jgi:hypothetical protein
LFLINQLTDLCSRNFGQLEHRQLRNSSSRPKEHVEEGKSRVWKTTRTFPPKEKHSKYSKVVGPQISSSSHKSANLNYLRTYQILRLADLLQMWQFADLGLAEHCGPILNPLFVIMICGLLRTHFLFADFKLLQIKKYILFLLTNVGFKFKFLQNTLVV